MWLLQEWMYHDYALLYYFLGSFKSGLIYNTLYYIIVATPALWKKIPLPDSDVLFCCYFGKGESLCYYTLSFIDCIVICLIVGSYPESLDFFFLDFWLLLKKQKAITATIYLACQFYMFSESRRPFVL